MRTRDSRHVWTGKNRDADIAELTAAIIGAVPGLYNRNGDEIVRLDPKTGKLIPVGLEDLRKLIAEHLVIERVVPDGSGDWKIQHFRYTFPAPRPGALTQASGLRQGGRIAEPDLGVLKQIYSSELVWRLPRVEANPSA